MTPILQYISAFVLSHFEIFVSIGVVFPKHQYYLQLHFNPTFVALVLGIFKVYIFIGVVIANLQNLRDLTEQWQPTGNSQLRGSNIT